VRQAEIDDAPDPIDRPGAQFERDREQPGGARDDELVEVLRNRDPAVVGCEARESAAEAGGRRVAPPSC
jgi:hypothetical protein